MLARHTTDEAAEMFDRAEVAVFPVGSTEQHGPALPLGTDYLTAEAIAESVESRDDVVLLPTMPVGISRHHHQFHGSLWLESDTFESYVRNIVDGVVEHGIRKVVFVNGHGGNTAVLREVARDLRIDQEAFCVPWVWTDSLDGLRTELFGSYGGHADETETSIMLYLYEDLVDKSKIEAAEEGGAESWGQSVHGGDIGFETLDVTSNGATGNPTNASKKAGEHLYETASSELDSLVEWLAERPLEGCWSADHR